MTFSLADASKWLDFVGMFDDAFNSFLSSYNTFINIQNVPPELEAEYNDALQQANSDYQTMVDLNALRDDAENYFSDYGQTIIDNPNVLGLQGYNRGLGFWPVVVGIGVAGALGALYLVQQHQEARDALVQKLAYINAGHSAAEANSLFGNPGQGLLGGLVGYQGISSALMPFALIAALIFLGPPLLKMIEGKRA